MQFSVKESKGLSLGSLVEDGDGGGGGSRELGSLGVLVVVRLFLLLRGLRLVGGLGRISRPESPSVLISV